MKVFVTGGAGYIGSHTVLQMLESGLEVCVYDDFSTGNHEALRRVQSIAKADIKIIDGDIRNFKTLNEAMELFKPDAVLHFAGLKSVAESVENPLEYYALNVAGSIAVLQAMQKNNCDKIIFSSSATVYGDADYLPVDEKHPMRPNNPYGQSKKMVEDIILDWTKSDNGKTAIILRYFNPVGSHSSGIIGEDPKQKPNNLMPLISRAAAGIDDKVSIFGNNYKTHDGTGERDYIHVEDLANAHLKALLYSTKYYGCDVFNIGTGECYTVLDLLNAFEAVSGKKIPFEICDRRAGDVASSVASALKAKKVLDWEAKHTLNEMCASTWLWQSRNPYGFG